MSILISEIDKAIASLSSAPSRIAVAVSGGPDSMALLHSAAGWADENTVQIHALTVDHGLRDGAAMEAQKVKGWCAETSFDIIHETLIWNHDGVQTRLQEEARNARYALMIDYCKQHDIDVLLIAHHQDDQAETFLIRLAAGSGINGLSAMAMDTIRDGVTFLRPFLGVGKTQLVQYCDDNHVPYVQDPSNQNDDFARVRLRDAHDVLAREGLTNKRLSVTAGRIRRAVNALSFYVDAFCSEHQKKKDSVIEIDLEAFRNAPEEISLRVIMQIFQQHNASKTYLPRMEKIENLTADLRMNTAFKARTLGGFIFSVQAKIGKIVIKPE